MAAPSYPVSLGQTSPGSYQPFSYQPLNARQPITPIVRPAPAQGIAPRVLAQPARAHYKCASIAWNILKNAFACTGVTVIITSGVYILSFVSGHAVAGISLAIAMPLVTLGAFSISAAILIIHALYHAIMHRPVIIPPRPLTEIECIEIELKQICKACDMAVEHNRLDLAFHQLKTLQAIMQPHFFNHTPPSIPMLVDCLPTLYHLLHLPLRQDVQAAYPQEYKELFARDCHALINWIRTIQQAGR